jgi:hypothetical protein
MVDRHLKASMQYFWASFVLQLIVYSLLCHVIIKYWGNRELMLLSTGGILLFLPFTVFLMRGFKKMAILKPVDQENGMTSVRDFVQQQQSLLRRFYNFKRGYELFLVPLSIAAGVLLIFNLYVPGSVEGHWLGAGVTFVVGVVFSAIAIHSENRKSFIQPIQRLQYILDEFEAE